MTDFDLTIIKTVLEHQKDNIEDVIVINKGMSNGDVIKAMFPNTEIMITDERVFLRDGTIVMVYSLTWWDEPYQKGGK